EALDRGKVFVGRVAVRLPAVDAHRLLCLRVVGRSRGAFWTARGARREGQRRGSNARALQNVTAGQCGEVSRHAWATPSTSKRDRSIGNPHPLILAQHGGPLPPPKVGASR